MLGYRVDSEVLPEHSVRSLRLIYFSSRCSVEFSEIGKHLFGGLVSVFTILTERLTDNALQIGRHVLSMRIKTRRFIIEERAKHFRLIVAAKGFLACDHLEEQDAQ